MASNGSIVGTSLPVSRDGSSQAVQNSLPSLTSDKGFIAQLADNPFFTAVSGAL